MRAGNLVDPAGRGTIITAGAFLPIPATEALLAAWAAALALLARRVYLQEKWKKS